jgi:hypothetical protein
MVYGSNLKTLALSPSGVFLFLFAVGLAVSPTRGMCVLLLEHYGSSGRAKRNMQNSICEAGK